MTSSNSSSHHLQLVPPSHQLTSTHIIIRLTSHHPTHHQFISSSSAAIIMTASPHLHHPTHPYDVRYIFAKQSKQTSNESSTMMLIFLDEPASTLITSEHQLTITSHQLIITSHHQLVLSSYIGFNKSGVCIFFAAVCTDAYVKQVFLLFGISTTGASEEL